MFLDLILIQNNLVEMEYNNISVFILQKKNLFGHRIGGILMFSVQKPL